MPVAGVVVGARDRPKSITAARDLHTIVDKWMSDTEEVTRQTMVGSIAGQPYLEVGDHKLSHDALRRILTAYVAHHIKVENMPPEAAADVDRVVDSIIHHYATRRDRHEHFKGEHEGRLMREFSGACVLMTNCAACVVHDCEGGWMEAAVVLLRSCCGSRESSCASLGHCR